MFHSKNGLFFERLQDGSVHIIRTYDARDVRPDNVVLDIILPENEWASVVCSVSADGENSARWMLARRFHGTDLPFGEHELKNATQEELTPEQKEWMKADLS